MSMGNTLISSVRNSLDCFLQTCIITGGNAGIGLSTAEAIAQQGGKVVLACRSLERGKSAAQVLQLTASAYDTCM